MKDTRESTAVVDERSAETIGEDVAPGIFVVAVDGPVAGSAGVCGVGVNVFTAAGEDGKEK